MITFHANKVTANTDAKGITTLEFTHTDNVTRSVRVILPAGVAESMAHNLINAKAANVAYGTSVEHEVR